MVEEGVNAHLLDVKEIIENTKQVANEMQKRGKDVLF